MLKIINLKKLTAKTLVGIFLVLGNLGTQSGNQKAIASFCDNNGHGNNILSSVTLNTGDTITVSGFDPSNPSNQKKNKLINKLKNGKTSGNGLTISYSNGAFNLSNIQANYVVDNLEDIKENCDSNQAENFNINDGYGIRVTIEDAEIQSTQLPYPDEYFVVDFNEQNGTNSFSRTNGNTTYSYSNDLEVKAANQWGGADGSKFITQKELQSIRSYSLTVSKDQKYFGFWWSAGDPYNEITFKNDDQTVAVFKTSDLVNFINEADSINASEYYGNPNGGYGNNGHLNEPFSFVNVFFDAESYDEVIVATMTEGGSAFESDNHTFSAIKQTPRGHEVPTNLAPTANDDTVTTTILSSVTIDVLANDTDPEGDEKTISQINNVFGGSAVIEDNKIVYTATSIPGEYSLSYTVEDENGNTDTGSVIINVIGFPD